MSFRVPFNRPFIAGPELDYIAEAVRLGNIGGDGKFTLACAQTLETRFGVGRVLMTPSCTAALEMAAMLLEIGPGDEVIMPSYTFVSTANAVARVGAKPVFVDIRPDTLNLDEHAVEKAITPRTKALFPVHYAGAACEMDTLLATAREHRLLVVEDAAQGVNAFYKGRALGSIGHMAAYSFHETKNYICGEGGALCLNAPELIERAEILRDKGTNRRKFFRGQVDKYTWVDVGGSYVPSEIVCAFLLAQLERMSEITERRKSIFEWYRDRLAPLASAGLLRLPHVPEDVGTNYHLFYVIVQDGPTRDRLLKFLKDESILAVFHYVPLHTSPMGLSLGYQAGQLPITEDLSARLIRLPLFHSITTEDQELVASTIERFYGA